MKTDTKGNDAGESDIEILKNNYIGISFTAHGITGNWHSEKQVLDAMLRAREDERKKLSSPSTEGAGKIQEIIDKIGTYYTDGQRYTKTDAVVDLKKLFQGAEKEQLSEEKWIEKLTTIFNCDPLYFGSYLEINQRECLRKLIKEAAKQICALSIPQPTQDEFELNWISPIKTEREQQLKDLHELGYLPHKSTNWQILNGLIDIAKKSISQPEGAKEEAKWISVLDRLPEDGNYAVITVENKIGFSLRKGNKWYDDIHRNQSTLMGIRDTFITHWMPLPEPPKS